MEFVINIMNKFTGDFGYLWNVKKLFCRMLGHSFELKSVSKIDMDEDITFCVYECKVCGLMSFE